MLRPRSPRPRLSSTLKSRPRPSSRGKHLLSITLTSSSARSRRRLVPPSRRLQCLPWYQALSSRRRPRPLLSNMALTGTGALQMTMRPLWRSEDSASMRRGRRRKSRRSSTRCLDIGILRHHTGLSDFQTCEPTGPAAVINAKRRASRPFCAALRINQGLVERVKLMRNQKHPR